MISPREYEIAELIAWGASAKEVAEELHISEETVRTHRRNILVKIHGHNAADLTRWYFQRKAKQCFGLNPRKVRHIAFFLMLLICVGEFIDSDMLRARQKFQAGNIAREVRAVYGKISLRIS